METIALFADNAVLPGLHVTLYSLLTTWPASRPLRIEVFTDGVPEREKDLLRETHARCCHASDLVITNHAPRRIPGGGTLHGNVTSYGRIYLAELMPDCDRCVYLDCDLIVGLSVEPFFDAFDNEHTLLVGGTTPVYRSLSPAIFREAGLDPEAATFNSGVVGMDLKRWRERRMVQACYRIAETYAGRLPGTDQVILNLACRDDFKVMDFRFNFQVFPFVPLLEGGVGNRVIHLAGAPKPWDFMGRRLNGQAPLWEAVYARTALAEVPVSRYRPLGRSLRISRSLFRTWRRR